MILTQVADKVGIIEADCQVTVDHQDRWIIRISLEDMENVQCPKICVISKCRFPGKVATSVAPILRGFRWTFHLGIKFLTEWRIISGAAGNEYDA